MPYTAQAKGAARLAQNSPNAVLFVVLVSLGEIAVLTALLRPWRTDGLYRRALGALAVLTVWTAFWLNVSPGGGPVFGYHALHLFVLWLVLAVLAVWARYLSRAEVLSTIDRG